MSPSLLLSMLCVVLVSCQTIIADACRSDYMFIAPLNSCYKYHTKMVKWLAARDACQSEEAVMFHPTDEAELGQVLTALSVGDNGGNQMLIGFSNVDQLNDYRTEDGRPMSQVYHKLTKGNTYKNNEKYVGFIEFPSQNLNIYKLNEYAGRFICKRHSATAEVVKTATGEVKTIIANANDKLSAMERQASIQSTLLERLIDAVVRQTDRTSAMMETLYRQSENQTEVMRQLLRAVDNLTTASNRQTERSNRQSASLERQVTNISAAMMRQVANITAVMDHQASALDKIAESDNFEINNRSDQ